MTVLVPLVGMYFRPPAKLVLGVLPSGASLRLVAEPDNPYDAKAIKVFVAFSEIPESQRVELAKALPSAGYDIDELEATGEIHLGYIADSDGKVCRATGMRGNREIAGASSGTLSFAADGSPLVVVEGI